MSENVVPIEQHRRPPAVKTCELRLRVNGPTRRLIMTLYSGTDIAAVLHWELQGTPPGFNLAELDAAWAEWREASEIAS